MAVGSNYDGDGERDENDEVHPDQERVDAQVDALVALQDPEVKQRYEAWIVDRRAVTDGPAEPGFRRVGVELTPKLDENDNVSDERLLTVDREIIAPADSEGDLVSNGFILVEHLCCELARYRIPDGGGPRRLTVTEALRRVRGRGILASANHAVMLGNTSKGGNSVEGSTRTPRFVESSSAPKGADQDADAPLVVVIDTGLDERSKARKDRFLDDIEAEKRDLDPLDEVPPFGPRPFDQLDLAAGHGTFVAGVIRQVEPRAHVVMIRALDTEGIGGEDMIATAICRARDVFEKHGGRGVLNLSLGIETIDDLPPLAIECALRELQPGVAVVAAAGNEPSRHPLWPAAHKRVLAVAGLCDDLSPTAWSNRGAFVDFSTRGEGIVSTFVGGTETQRQDEPPATTFPFGGQNHAYALWTGTSFATPQVAAMIADLIAEDPSTDVEEAVQDLRSDKEYRPGWGYVVPVLPPADPPLRCSRSRHS